MKRIKIMLSGAIIIAFVLSGVQLKAQEEDLFTQGTVWELTFIKLKANMGEDYLKGLSKTWKASMDELVKQKLLKSYKILMGDASNPQDFDLILMTEIENLAAMDPDPARDKKIQEIEKKVMDSMGEEFGKTVANYSTMREITGRKVMREIYLK